MGGSILDSDIFLRFFSGLTSDFMSILFYIALSSPIFLTFAKFLESLQVYIYPAQHTPEALTLSENKCYKQVKLTQ